MDSQCTCQKTVTEGTSEASAGRSPLLKANVGKQKCSSEPIPKCSGCHSEKGRNRFERRQDWTASKQESIDLPEDLNCQTEDNVFTDAHAASRDQKYRTVQQRSFSVPATLPDVVPDRSFLTKAENGSPDVLFSGSEVESGSTASRNDSICSQTRELTMHVEQEIKNSFEGQVCCAPSLDAKEENKRKKSVTFKKTELARMVSDKGKEARSRFCSSGYGSQSDCSQVSQGSNVSSEQGSVMLDDVLEEKKSFESIGKSQDSSIGEEEETSQNTMQIGLVEQPITSPEHKNEKVTDAFCTSEAGHRNPKWSETPEELLDDLEIWRRQMSPKFHCNIGDCVPNLSIFETNESMRETRVGSVRIPGIPEENFSDQSKHVLEQNGKTSDERVQGNSKSQPSDVTSNVCLMAAAAASEETINVQSPENKTPPLTKEDCQRELYKRLFEEKMFKFDPSEESLYDLFEWLKNNIGDALSPSPKSPFIPQEGPPATEQNFKIPDCVGHALQGKAGLMGEGQMLHRLCLAKGLPQTAHLPATSRKVPGDVANRQQAKPALAAQPVHRDPPALEASSAPALALQQPSASHGSCQEGQQQGMPNVPASNCHRGNANQLGQASTNINFGQIRHPVPNRRCVGQGHPILQGQGHPMLISSAGLRNPLTSAFGNIWQRNLSTLAVQRGKGALDREMVDGKASGMGSSLGSQEQRLPTVLDESSSFNYSSSSFSLSSSVGNSHLDQLVNVSQCSYSRCDDPDCLQVKRNVHALEEALKRKCSDLGPDERQTMSLLNRHYDTCDLPDCPVSWCPYMSHQCCEEQEVKAQQALTLLLSNPIHTMFPKDPSWDLIEKLDSTFQYDCERLGLKEWAHWLVMYPMSRSLTVAKALPLVPVQPGKHWVVKMTCLHEGENQLQMIRKLRDLNHPHIINHVWFSASTVKDLLLVCTDFLPGVSVRDLLDQGGPLSCGQTCAYLLQICSATKRLHSMNIVYLNWTCSNLLLDQSCQKLKMTNFTTSIDLSTENVDYGMVKLMLPADIVPAELLVSGGRLTHKSDSWGLACVLHAMLTCVRPWYHLRHLSRECTRNRILPQIPPALSAEVKECARLMIQTCLQKSPESRLSVGEIENRIHHGLI